MANERPVASSDSVRLRMQTQPRRDTKPEVALRKHLFAHGLRYRVAYPVPGMPRRSIDIAFPKAKLAVFVDGCFWHSCPEHGVSPKNSSEWWRSKLEQNQLRDAATTTHLREQGWQVLRVWEHEAPSDVLPVILAVISADAGPPSGKAISSRM